MGTFITEEIFSEGGITGTSVSATTISGGTFYGNGANLTSVSASFNGGTVTGGTNFTGGLSANTISATTITGGTFYGDGSNLTGLVPTSRTISTTSPLSGGGDLTTNRTISIQDAAADGTTKGASTFTASDFSSSSGLISIDYTNAQSASSTNKGFLTSSDWTTFNNKANASGTINEIAYFSAGSTINSLTTATYPSLTELSYVKGVTSAIQTQIDGKQATLTNGYGIAGTTTKSVSLTTAEAFCTAETTLNTATYADITGASITLAAGTWLILATINASSQSTTVTVINGAITDGANAVVVEGAQHIVAGTATVRTWGNMCLSAIVSPAGSTTYKLRGARGTTTQTGNVIVSDGTGVNTANNVSNNSDKSTSIRAIRIS